LSLLLLFNRNVFLSLSPRQRCTKKERGRGRKKKEKKEEGDEKRRLTNQIDKRASKLFTNSLLLLEGRPISIKSRDGER